MPPWVFLCFVAAGLLASLVLTPLAAALARRSGAMDHPDPRKAHREPIPLLGGVAIFLAFNGVILGALGLGLLVLKDGDVALVPGFLRPYLANIAADSGHVLRRLGMIGAGGLAVFLLGLWDDLRSPGVGVRLSLQFVIAGFVVHFGIRPELGFLPHPLVTVAATVWIVGIMNAFNFIDGLDGLTTGVGAIAGAILAVAMVRWSQPLVALLLCTLTGTLIGFLRYNFYPASIFLGSSGSLLLGYLLGVIVLVSTFIVTPRDDVLPIVMPVLIMGIPLYDMASVLVIRRARGTSVFQGDRNHLGHRLMRRGFTHKQAVLCIYALTFSVGLNALILPTLRTTDSILVLVQVLALFGVVILLERVRARPGPDGES